MTSRRKFRSSRAWGRTFALWTASAVAAPTVAFGAPLTLADALATARRNQPQLRSARAQTELARARSDEARAALLPQLSAQASYNRSTANYVPRPGALPRSLNGVNVAAPANTFDTYGFWSFSVNAQQTLFDFGRTWGQWNAAGATAAAQAEDERTQVLAVDLSVRTAFFNARAAKALAEVAAETLANQERHLAQIQGFVEVGTRPEIDIAQARTDRANARVQLINAQNSYALARAQLNQAMGVERDTSYELADESLPPVEHETAPPAALVEEAVRVRPELARLQALVRAQELTISATRAGYAPALNLSTSFTDSGRDLDALAWNWSGGFTLVWSIFQGGLTRAQVHEQNANLTATRAQIDIVRLQVRLDIEQAQLSLRAAQEAIAAATEAEQNARRRLELAEGRYATGVGNIIELGDAQVALTTTAAQKVQADYNLALARAQLLNALGRE